MGTKHWFLIGWFKLMKSLRRRGSVQEAISLITFIPLVVHERGYFLSSLNSCYHYLGLVCNSLAAWIIDKYWEFFWKKGTDETGCECALCTQVDIHGKWANWLLEGQIFQNSSRYGWSCQREKFARQELCGRFSVYGKKWTNFFVITVFYILKQLSTSVSIKMVDINLATLQLSKNPPLFTSIWVKNC